MVDFIHELNESQKNAVLHNDSASLVIAGAGSGKTRVLTYKIAYLLQTGYPAYSILALTFTNKAAREMKERIARIVGIREASRLWMGTFHSIFSRILRREAEAILTRGRARSPGDTAHALFSQFPSEPRQDGTRPESVKDLQCPQLCGSLLPKPVPNSKRIFF